MLSNRLRKLSLARSSSSTLRCSSLLTVLSSSLTDCASSREVSSSSLADCSSSLIETSSSLADFSSSSAVSYSSTVDCSRWRESRKSRSKRSAETACSSVSAGSIRSGLSGAPTLENLRAGQVFIFCSTKDVYGNHIDSYDAVPESCSTAYCGQSAYEWSKLIAEKYVNYYAARAGARAAVLRLSTVYAPATPGNAGGFVSFLF